jgi:pyruvate dehydrogenase (quinone)/pyruvate oxidase
VKCVQIDLDPARLGLRHPVDAALCGDARAVLEALLPRLKRNEDRAFIEKAQAGRKQWNALMHLRATDQNLPMKPQVIARELGLQLEDDAIILCDSGTAATWYARHIPIKKGQLCTLSGTLASMACGLPYAIAAQIAYPDRQVVALVGDGAFSMLMAELATAKKYELPIKIVVIKNDSLGMIRWEQMIHDGNPEYGCELEPIDFVKFAEACGVDGISIEDPRLCAQELREALDMPGPTLIEAVVDPNEPMMPARITWGQASHLMRALARGTRDEGRLIKTLFRDKTREMI